VLGLEIAIYRQEFKVISKVKENHQNLNLFLQGFVHRIFREI